MSRNFALPAAVDYKDRRALRGLDNASLRKLTEECEAWFAWTEALGSALTTASAKTEWKILVRHEIDEVTAAHARLRHEMLVRQARLHFLRKEVKARRDGLPVSSEGWREAAE